MLIFNNMLFMIRKYTFKILLTLLSIYIFYVLF